ncbi:hypothetical protein BDP27DRAFT_1415328 [Rhodocollybia butyracea]|uniref:F-box domain-containing protein n=1 Tax=Rhodocollybia butyracea TaxID=206335 RepID=A0A9P5UDT9_9AGAR|nr:hypothetical protein BDP27DRAFT_1415328 [Rhodocollybia butyracea]
MPVPHIPIELWLLVAQFIPPHMLKNLMSVNRAFFCAEMAQRYKEVGFFRAGARFHWFAIACASYEYGIRPYFIQELLPSDADGSSGTASLPDPLSSLECTFSSLSNLTEYHLAWFELPFVDDVPIDILRAPMLGSIRVQKLFLEASLPKLGLLLSFEERLPQLQELNISIRRDFGKLSNEEVAQDEIQFTSLISFLNRHQSTLQSFSFSSTYALDCAPLFQSLDRFPSLHEFTLSVPTPSPHLGDPSSLAKWMHTNCPSLHSLTLKTHFADDGLAWETSFQDWIRSFVLSHPNVIPSLRSLKLSSGINTYSVYLLVRHFSHIITSLDLSGRHMTFDQVATVMKELSFYDGSRVTSKLTVLRMGPVTLSPELIDLLAELLPELKELDLRINNAVPHSHSPAAYTWTGYKSRNTRSQDTAQVEAFFEVMEKRRYPRWGLRRVAVWKFNSKLQYQPRFVELFKECIPNLAI